MFSARQRPRPSQVQGRATLRISYFPERGRTPMNSHQAFFSTACSVCLIAFVAVSAGMADTATVEEHKGCPALFINGEPVPPFAYMSYLGRETYYREAAQAGIHLYCFPAYLGDRGINPTSGHRALSPGHLERGRLVRLLQCRKGLQNSDRGRPAGPGHCPHCISIRPSGGRRLIRKAAANCPTEPPFGSALHRPSGARRPPGPCGRFSIGSSTRRMPTT